METTHKMLRGTCDWSFTLSMRSEAEVALCAVTQNTTLLPKWVIYWHFIVLYNIWTIPTLFSVTVLWGVSETMQGVKLIFCDKEKKKNQNELWSIFSYIMICHIPDIVNIFLLGAPLQCDGRNWGSLECTCLDSCQGEGYVGNFW